MYQVIEFYQQNLQLARESGQRREEMSALASLARAYDALQEREKAVEYYELALEIARQLGDSRTERDTLKHLNETLNPQPAKEPKAKARANKAAKPRKAKAKNSPRKKGAVKAAKKATKKAPLRKKHPAPDSPDAETTGSEE